jgi:hypothetical protein
MSNELEGMWKEAAVFKFSIPVLTSDSEKQTRTPIIIIGITADTQTRNASNTSQKRSRVLSQLMVIRHHVNTSNTTLKKPQLKLNTSYFTLSHSLRFSIQT